LLTASNFRTFTFSNNLLYLILFTGTWAIALKYRAVVLFIDTRADESTTGVTFRFRSWLANGSLATAFIKRLDKHFTRPALSDFDLWALFFNTFVLSRATAFCSFGKTFDLFELTLVAFHIINNFRARDFHFFLITTLTRSFAISRTAFIFFFDGGDVFSFASFGFFSARFFSNVVDFTFFAEVTLASSGKTRVFCVSP